MDGPVVFDRRGFEVASPHPRSLAWDEVLKITAYKTDLFTVDEIRVSFEHAEGEVVVTEESPGFSAFMEQVVHQFPSVVGWHEKVSQPAFAPCNTVLFERLPSALHT